MAVITYDSTAILADFSRRRGITFPLLADQGSATITSTDFSTRRSIPGRRTMAFRSQVCSSSIDRASSPHGFSKRLMRNGHRRQDPAETGRSGTRGRRSANHHGTCGDHDLRERSVVAPGTLFSIVVDVMPRPGMHVYAPGTHSYKVIALRLDSQPLLLARPLRYPHRRSTSSSR